LLIGKCDKSLSIQKLLLQCWIKSLSLITLTDHSYFSLYCRHKIVSHFTLLLSIIFWDIIVLLVNSWDNL